MAIVNGYCTDAELQQWNQATAPATTLVRERAINAASRAIDQYCQRVFWLGSAEAREFDTCDPYRVTFGVFNDLVSITTLAVDTTGDGTWETTWSASDYQLAPINPTAAPEQQPYREILAVASRRFPTPTLGRAVGRVQVTGTWGWPAVPEAVNQACLMLAARIFARKESPQGVAGFGEFGQIRVRASDPDVAALLDPYKHPAAAVMVA